MLQFTSTFLPALPSSLFFKTNLFTRLSVLWYNSTQNSAEKGTCIDRTGSWKKGKFIGIFGNLSNKAYPRKIATTTNAAITPRVAFVCKEKVSNFNFCRAFGFRIYRIVFVVGHFLLHLPNKLWVMSKWAEWDWKSLIPAANNRSCVTAQPLHCPSSALPR